MRIAFAVMFWLNAAVAFAQLHATPITEATPPYVFEDFSVTAPPGKSWFEMKRDKQQALFGKKVDSPTHSFAATAASGGLPEKFENRDKFQEYVNKMRTVEIDPRRFKIIEFDSKIDDSYQAWCVRYHLKHTDNDAVLARNRSLIVEDFGIACLHPDRNNLIVDVGYSERGRAAELGKELSAQLRQEGESFVRSLKFKTR